MVLGGSRTWVSYLHPEGTDTSGLPELKKGILHPGSGEGNATRTGKSHESVDPEHVTEINVVYAKDYRVLNDLLIIARKFREI